MAKPDPRERIIAHMNADHADSLRLYLEHYHEVPSFTARTARLTDVSPMMMEIRTANNSLYRIPFEPPLKDWSETRPRVVAMDQEARKSLARSEITVKRYVRPQKAWQWGLLVAVTFTLILLGRGRDALSPTSGGLTAPLKEKYPGVFEFLYKIQPQVFYPMLVIHLVEVALMRRRLWKHNVPTGGALWWKWVSMTFLEGFPNFQRFDAVVERERKAREGKKH